MTIIHRHHLYHGKERFICIAQLLAHFDQMGTLYQANITNPVGWGLKHAVLNNRHVAGCAHSVTISPRWNAAGSSHPATAVLYGHRQPGAADSKS